MESSKSNPITVTLWKSISYSLEEETWSTNRISAIGAGFAAGTIGASGTTSTAKAVGTTRTSGTAGVTGTIRVAGIVGAVGIC